jgi:hypothetical protein
VPALLLGGRLDTRTPLENARATAKELPHSTIVALKGSGHDALDSDITGCTAQALARFIDDVAVGTRAWARTTACGPTPLPAASLRDFRSGTGVGARRGRACSPCSTPVTDARLERAAGAVRRAAGQRAAACAAGASRGRRASTGRLRLHGYAFVPGLPRHRLALHQSRA